MKKKQPETLKGFALLIKWFRIPFTGPLAHLVEHLICNEGVAGSSPVRSTKYKKRPCGAFCFLGGP